jgi:hypothetical protein
VRFVRLRFEDNLQMPVLNPPAAVLAAHVDVMGVGASMSLRTLSGIAVKSVLPCFICGAGNSQHRGQDRPNRPTPQYRADSRCGAAVEASRTGKLLVNMFIFIADKFMFIADKFISW